MDIMKWITKTNFRTNVVIFLVYAFGFTVCTGAIYSGIVAILSIKL